MLMLLVQEPKVCGGSLEFADKCRKGIAKKKPKIVEECKKEFFEIAKKNNCNELLSSYVWNCLFVRQLGYSFNRLWWSVQG